MRVFPRALMGAVGALLLNGCTSTPESSVTPEATTPTPAVENVSEDPPRVTRIFAPTYPQLSRLPPRLDAGDRSVTTRLQCPNDRRKIIEFYFLSEMTLRELTLYLTDKPFGSTAVIVMQSSKDALVLHLNERGNLIGRSHAYRQQGSWFPNGITHCANKKGPGIVPGD